MLKSNKDVVKGVITVRIEGSFISAFLYQKMQDNTIIKMVIPQASRIKVDDCPDIIQKALSQCEEVVVNDDVSVRKTSPIIGSNVKL